MSTTIFPNPSNPDLPEPEYAPAQTYEMLDAEGNVTTTTNFDGWLAWSSSQVPEVTEIPNMGTVTTFLVIPLSTPPQWETTYEPPVGGTLFWFWDSAEAAANGHAEVVTYVETQLETPTNPPS